MRDTKIVYLLGAGASVDAGMPTVAQLTQELKDWLPGLRDVNRQCRPEFQEIFDVLSVHDPEVAGNYERFFEWTGLLLKVRTKPFNHVIASSLSKQLVDALASIPYVVGDMISELLERRQTEPSYLARFADFLPPSGRLNVFTLNYDCCLEDASKEAGVPLTTGFDPGSKRWRPSLFAGREQGINLYKFHGSLRWFLDKDASLRRSLRTYVELPREGAQHARRDSNQKVTPELLLGPASKIQADDPFLTLFYEFHRAMARARVCVIVGYGYRDDHVNTVLDQAAARGMRILDVNPGNPCGRYMADNYLHLRFGAREALLNGLILRETQRFLT